MITYYYGFKSFFRWDFPENKSDFVNDKIISGKMDDVFDDSVDEKELARRELEKVQEKLERVDYRVISS